MFAASLLMGGCFLGADPLPGSVHDDAQILPDTPPPPPDAPPPAVCKDATNTVATGNHNPGLDCEAGNCHGPLGTAPGRWTVSGTLYAAPTGTTIVKYATISIVDAKGVKLDLVSSLNGNFYTTEALTYPIRVYASKCPSLMQMGSSVQDGSCNGCHKLGGATTQQINLP